MCFSSNPRLNFSVDFAIPGGFDEDVEIDPRFVLGCEESSDNEHNLEKLVFGDDPEYLIDKFQTPSEKKRKQPDSSDEDVNEDDNEIDDSFDEIEESEVETENVLDSDDFDHVIEESDLGDSDDEVNLEDLTTGLIDKNDDKANKIENTEKEKLKAELKAKHIGIYGAPAWANLDQIESSKPSKSDISDDEDDILHQADDYLLSRCETLPQGIISVRKMTNLNDSSKAEGSVIKAVEFHPSSTVALAAGKAGIATLFQVDGKTNPKIQSIKFKNFPISTAHFSANGHEFIVGSEKNGDIYYYDMMAGKVSKVPWEKDMACKNMALFKVSPDNRIIAFHGQFGRIHLLTAKSKEWIGSMKMNHHVRALAFNNDGSRLYAHGNGGEVYIFDMSTRDCIHKFYDDGCVKGTAINISPDNTRIACGSDSGVINVYDSSKIWTKSPKPSKMFLNLTTQINDVKINHSNEFMVMASDVKDNAIKLAHLQSMTVFSNFPLNHFNMKRPLCFDLSLNSGYLAIANNCSKVFLYSADMGPLSFLVVLCLFGVASAKAPDCPSDPDKCKLPSCRCSSTDIPGNLDAKNTPQIVLLTFDDAVSELLYNKYYKTLMQRKNPNGCPIGITFFTSHEYTDYTILREVYEKGHEIAIHSISHKADTNYWKNGNAKTWTDEMVGMRKMAELYSGIPRKDMRGIRAPLLQGGGNTQFEMMQSHGFEWDCSLPTQNQVDPGIWPYSLKYASNQECQIPPCPTEAFPDVWVVPMIDLFDKNKTACAMLDTCIVTTKKETRDLLSDNFYVHYNGNRSPYGLYVHAAWFLQDIDESDGHWAGYNQFLDEIMRKHDDVYVITVTQALQWTRSPQSLTAIKNFPSWKTQCSPQKAPRACNKKQCKLTKKDASSGGERWMWGCFRGGNCPSCYPWLGTPEGAC
uniref:NodB homology domain-containing protein n=1 Tax=Strigamia maritima TaxID=126957 RepID=T1INF8_STRMM